MSGESIPESYEGDKMAYHMDQLNEAGWHFKGGDTVVGDEVVAGWVKVTRHEDKVSPTPEIIIQAFNLTDEDGDVLPGYSFSETGAGAVMIGYDGSVEERDEFIEDLVALGNFLDSMQEIRDKYGVETLRYAFDLAEDREILEHPDVQQGLADLACGRVVRLEIPRRPKPVPAEVEPEE